MASDDAEDQLNEALDRLRALGAAGSASPAADDGLAATARRFQAMDRRDAEPEPDVRFLQRLEDDLMHAAASRRTALTPPLRGDPLPILGEGTKKPPSPNVGRGGLGGEGFRRPRRIDLRGLSHLAAAAMILLTLAAGLAAYRLLPGSGSQLTPSIPAMGVVATPTSSAAPGAGPVGVPVLVWKKSIGSGGMAPVVADGRVYVFQDPEDQGANALEALDLATGAKIWSAPLVHIYTLVPPVVADGQVYIVSSQAVVALSATTGKQEWTYPLEDQEVSPVAAGGRVYLMGRDYTLRAIDAQTGKDLWRVPVPGARPQQQGATFTPWGAPAVANGIVYAAGTGGWLFAVRATDGHQLWTFDTGGELAETIRAADDVVVVTAMMSAKPGSPHQIQLFARDAKTGQPRWTTALSAQSTIAIGDGAVYAAAGTLQHNASLVALDLHTGHLRWTYQTSADRFGPPVLAGGQIYISSESDGTIRRVDATTGKENWSVYLNSGTPAVAGGLVVVAGNGSVYAVGGNGQASTVNAAATPVDLSGEPVCNAPRPAPTGPISGTPSATIPAETEFMHRQSGATVNGQSIGGFQWPQILLGNLPDGPAASAADVSEINQTLRAMMSCASRPEAATAIAGFFTDDFFRRGVVTAGQNGYILTLGLQPVEKGLTRLQTHVLPDGRVEGIILGPTGKAGTLFVFKQVGGTWLIDEVYQIVPAYQAGG